MYAIVDVYAQCYSVSIVPRAKQSVQSVPCENDEKESSDEQGFCCLCALWYVYHGVIHAVLYNLCMCIQLYIAS